LKIYMVDFIFIKMSHLNIVIDISLGEMNKKKLINNARKLRVILILILPKKWLHQ